MSLAFRPAALTDVPLLARLNAGLQRDEGSRRRLDEAALVRRMSDWLATGAYRAHLVWQADACLGYALHAPPAEAVFLRHLYVVPEARRQGVGQALLRHLRERCWPAGMPVQLDVLAGNVRAQAFWAAQGFVPYSLRLEAPGLPSADPQA